MDTTNQRAEPTFTEETDRVAAAMLGLDLNEFRAMTYLAKTQYRSLAHNLLQVAKVTPK
jgi:hypothetical protein